MNHLPHRTGNSYSFGDLVAEGLTPRESQVLLLRATGLSAKSIAQALQCSASNVAQILNSLFFKLNANSSNELIAKAFITKHLRTLSVVLLMLCGANVQDPSTLARPTRTSTTQSLRAQREQSTRKLWS